MSENAQAAPLLAHNLEASVDGTHVPHLVGVDGLSTVLEYDPPHNNEAVGAFKSFKPGKITLWVRLGKTDLLRKMCETREEMLKPRQMVFRWVGPDDQPVTTTNLTNARFVRFEQAKAPGSDTPLERYELVAESLTVG